MKATVIIVLGILTLSGCGTLHNQGTITYQTTQDYNIKGSLSEQEKSELVMFSFNLLDTKYNWGSKKPDFGLDCSGLVSYVFKNSINIKLTGAARDIVKNGVSIPLHHAKTNKLELGDLLFFNTTGQSYSHVGIYIGNNSFLHASSKQKKVIITNLSSSYYLNRLEEIKRI